MVICADLDRDDLVDAQETQFNKERRLYRNATLGDLLDSRNRAASVHCPASPIVHCLGLLLRPAASSTITTGLFPKGRRHRHAQA